MRRTTRERRSVDFDEVLTRYEPVIGLETHVELGTASKMFCGCSTTFGAEPNTQTCPVCLGLPGALPVANAAAIEATIRIGLALGCRIATWCRFARKNYFYPDIPKGFQTSQYDEPLCTAGHLDVEVDGETYRVEIERVHLEEDTGKNLHVGGATGRIHGADHSLIDYNRAGIPLVEIVTRPIPGDRRQGARGRPRLRHRAARDPARARRLRGAHGAGQPALRRQHLAGADRQPGVGHPHRDQERQLAALGRARGALRDAPAGRRPRRRRPGAAGDPALPRGHRQHLAGPEQGGGDRLPVLPRARPGADRARTRSGWRSSPPRCPSCRPPAGPGCQEEWGLSPTEMAWLVNAGARRAGRATPSPPAPRRPTPASGGWASWPAGPTTPASSWPSCRSRRRRSPSWPAGRRGHDQRPAGPPGARRRAGRRGRPRPGGRGPRAGRHGGVRRAGRRRRRGDRGQPRRRREGARRQGPGDRRAGRRGHEGHPRQGRRRHRQAHARGARSSVRAALQGPAASLRAGRGHGGPVKRGVAAGGRRHDPQHLVVVVGGRADAVAVGRGDPQRRPSASRTTVRSRPYCAGRGRRWSTRDRSLPSSVTTSIRWPSSAPRNTVRPVDGAAAEAGLRGAGASATGAVPSRPTAP